MRNSEKQGFNCEDCIDCRHYIYYGMFTCVWSGMDATIKDHESCRLNMDMEQVITVVMICDYNQGPRQEIIPEHVKLSLNAPDNIIIQDLHHTNVSTTPDGFSLFTLKGKYYGTNVSWDIHHILED